MKDSTLEKIAAIGLAIFMLWANEENWMDKSSIIIFGVAVFGASIFLTVINIFEKIQKLEDRFFNNR